MYSTAVYVSGYWDVAFAFNFPSTGLPKSVLVQNAELATRTKEAIHEAILAAR